VAVGSGTGASVTVGVGAGVAVGSGTGAGATVGVGAGVAVGAGAGVAVGAVFWARAGIHIRESATIDTRTGLGRFMGLLLDSALDGWRRVPNDSSESEGPEWASSGPGCAVLEPCGHRTQRSAPLQGTTLDPCGLEVWSIVLRVDGDSPAP